jgi:hypothetical protein
MRFYFHLNSAQSVEDDEGMELPSAEDARDHAVTVAFELTKNAGNRYAGYEIQVVDAEGHQLFTVPLWMGGSARLH